MAKIVREECESKAAIKRKLLSVAIRFLAEMWLLGVAIND